MTATASTPLADTSSTPGRYATLSGMLIAAVLLTNWPTYNFVVRGGPIALWFYLVPAFLCLPLFAVRPAIIERLVRQPLFLWFAAYVIVGLVWLPFSQSYEDADRQWRLRALDLSLFVPIALILSQSKRKQVAWVIVCCMLLAVIDNWFDFLYPFSFVPEGGNGSNPGRGAGLFINANQSAAAILMMAIAALPFVSSRYRALVILIAIAGVIPTFSRFGFLFAILFVLFALSFGLLNRKQAYLLSAVLFVLGLLAGTLMEFTQNVEYGRENILGRIAWFETIGNETDASEEERWVVAQRAWEMFMDAPVLGHGIASTVNWDLRASTHNMYLLFLAEQGMVGCLMYLVFLGLVLRRGLFLWRRRGCAMEIDIGKATVLYGLFLCVYSLVSHNVVDEPHGLFVMAFLWIASDAALPEPALTPVAA